MLTSPLPLSFSEAFMGYPLELFMCSFIFLLNLADSSCNGLAFNIFFSSQFSPSCHIPLITGPLSCNPEAQIKLSLKVISCISFKHHFVLLHKDIFLSLETSSLVHTLYFHTRSGAFEFFISIYISC